MFILNRMSGQKMCPVQLSGHLRMRKVQGGGSLVASLTPSCVTQLFAGTVPSTVLNPSYPGARPENTRRLNRKKSKFEPAPKRSVVRSTQHQRVGGVFPVLLA